MSQDPDTYGRQYGDSPSEDLLPYEVDPAAPLAEEVQDDEQVARDLANYGEAGEEEFEETAPSASAAEAAPELPINWASVQSLLQACVTSNPRVRYGLGAKIPSDASKPGTGFTKVDCSGFVRAAIRRSTSPKVAFPDGSVVQHDWVKAKGFARGTLADGALTDGKIRIAFLLPSDSPSRIGHVVLIRNGKTVESHSGVGPNSRPFDGTGWQRKAKVYLLRS